MRPVYDRHSDVREWVAKNWQLFPDEGTQYIGIEDRHGTIRGAAVFTDYNGHDITLTGLGHYVFSRSVLRAVCAYVFVQLNCRRMTVIVRSSRWRLILLCQRHKFQVEGVIRSHYGNENGVLMGLLREDCRWLTDKERWPHGKPPVTTARTRPP